MDELIDYVRADVLRVRALYRAHPGLATVMLAQTEPERDRSADIRAASMRAELASLVRLGVPVEKARPLFEAAVRWTLAAIIAEELPHPAPELDEQRFHDGLEMFLVGMRAAVVAATV